MAHTSVAEATVTAGDTFYTVDPALATYPTTGKISGSVLLVSANITTTPTPVTAANGLYVQPGTSTTWAVTQSGSWTVAVTGVATAANQATEIASLASIDGKLPALGQALAAASVPVVLTAAQITTLTPPAAITGFATSANQTTEITHLATLAGAVTGTEVQVDVLTMPTVAVTGTFWQATQPVSHSTLAVVGGGTEATAMRVTLASDSTGVLSIDDNGGSITVDGTVAITSSALTNIQSGYHNIDEVAGGTDTGTAILAIRDDALASLTPIEGDWNALRVNARGATWIAIEDGAGGQITSFSGGTQYAEDAAHVSGNTGTMALAVRSDTAASTAGTDGDYTALITDSTGRLHCNVSNTLTVASHAVTNAGTFAVQAVCTNAGTFAVQAAQSGTWNITNVSGTVSLPTGAATAAKQPALGTAGTASADVITVQGIASMTALKVDGSAVTQPVSLTSTTVTGTVAVTQSGTWDEVGINDSGNSITVDWAGTAPPIGAGLEATALRVTLATDSTGVVSIDDNGGAITVDGTVAFSNTTIAVTNVGTFAVQAVCTNAGTFAVQAACTNAGTFVVQVDGTALTRLTSIATNTDSGAVVGNGAAATAQRVSIANDSTGILAGVTTVTTVTTVATLTSITNWGNIVDDAAFTPGTTRVLMIGFEADETATDSVDEGDGGAARMTLDRKVIVTDQPHTSGGCLIFRSLDLDETEEEVKASAGQIYGGWITNLATSTRYIKFYNATAANVTVGTTTPVITMPLQGGTTPVSALLNMLGGKGIAFDTAISVAATTGLADNDTGAPGASEVVINLFYK